MKFIFLILSLVLITAGSAYYVAPQLRDFHEGVLKRRVVKSLDNKGYIDVEVSMNHLHASEIKINRIARDGETKDSIKDDVLQIVRDVVGATAKRDDIHVNFENASNETEVEKPSMPQIAVKGKESKEDSTPDKVAHNELKVASKSDHMSDPKPPETIPPEPAMASSEIYIEWNERKNEIRVDGKLSNTSQRDDFVSMLKKEYKSAVITDNLMANKEMVAESGHVLKLKNYLPKIIQVAYGKGSVRMVDDPASLTLSGTLKSKADFETLNSQLKPLMESPDGKPLQVKNNLKYHPVFVIEKDDKQRAVILSGYANRNSSVNLSSYIKRYTQKASNQYVFKSEIIPDERSVEYVWSDVDQRILDEHLKNVVRGKIYYENDIVSKLTGVTADAEYDQMLKDRFSDKATALELTYDANAKSDNAKAAKAKQLVEVEAKKEQLAAAKQLRTELKEYKIFFESGSKKLDSQYEPLMKEIAQTILKSEDKLSLIVIGGFADHTGDAAFNEKLSNERASNVQVKLVELGVPITRTVVEFFGAENADVDKKLSRRVEIRVR